MVAACLAGIRPASAAAFASAASKRSMWRSVLRSEKASAVAAAAPSALTRAPAMSDVEEHGFVRTAEMDGQAPGPLAVLLRQQSRAARRIDHLQYGILGIGRIAVEVEPRRDSIEQAAGEDRHVYVWRLHAARRPRHAARLDGGEDAAAVGEGRGAAVAFEARVERQIAPILGVVVAAVAVGLPDLEQPVRHDGALRVMQRERHLDALARHARRGE